MAPVNSEKYLEFPKMQERLWSENITSIIYKKEYLYVFLYPERYCTSTKQNELFIYLKLYA